MPGPRPSRRSLGLRLAFSFVTTGIFLGLATGVVAALERAGLVDTFRQDDTVLYLTGTYLKPDARKRQYQIMDAQFPSVVQATFPTHKRAGVFRVFIAGESFVRGGHHLPPGSPTLGHGTVADWTQEVLEARYPSVDFEVVNAGANGANSFRVASVVAELVHGEPDLIVVTVGNNEGFAPVSQVSAELHDWVLFRFLKKVVVAEPAKADRPPYMLQTLSAGDTQRNFESNVRRMVATAQAAGVPILLATLPINLTGLGKRVSAGEHAQLRSAPECALVVERLAAGACEAALEASEPCGRQFLVTLEVAECLREQGRHEDARALYEVAVQLDPRGRTRPSQNEALRTIALQTNVPLADVDRDVVEHSPNHLPGDRYFIDDVHLTCMGYLRPARTIVAAMGTAGLVHGSAKEPLPEPTTERLLKRASWDPEDTPFPVSPELVARAHEVCEPDPAGD